jgi:hypothetical protein
MRSARGPSPRILTGSGVGMSDVDLLAVALVRYLLERRGEAGSWPKWRGAGRTCPRGCRIKARRTGGSAGCGARSSSGQRCWRLGCLPMTASRSIPPRRSQNTPPGSAADGWTGLDNDRAPVRPRRRARRMVIRVPAGHQGRPRLTAHPGLEHRARRGQRARGRRPPSPGRSAARDVPCDKGFSGWPSPPPSPARGTAILVPPAKDQRATTPVILLAIITRWRSRIDVSFSVHRD